MANITPEKLQELQYKAADLKRLQTITLQLSSHRFVDEVSQNIVNAITDSPITGYSQEIFIAVIYLDITGKKEELRFYKMCENDYSQELRTLYQDPYENRVISLRSSDENLVQRSFFEGKVFTADEVQEIIGKEAHNLDVQRTNTFYQQWGVQSQIVIPLRIKNRSLGVLNVSTKFPREKIPPRITDNLTAFASQAAIALDNARLYTETKTYAHSLEQQTRDLKRLEKASKHISESLDFDVVAQTIVNSLAEPMRTGSGLHRELINAILYTIEDGYFTLKAMSRGPAADHMNELYGEKLQGLKIAYRQSSESLFYTIYDRKKTQIANSLGQLLGRKKVNQTKEQAIKDQWNMQSHVLTPLKHDRRVLGALQVSTVYPLDQVPQRVIDHIESFASHAAIALENANYYEQIEEQNHELKRMNHELKALDQAKSEFLSIASHQLRTPLSGIRGYLQLLENGDYGPINNDQKSAINKVERNASRLVVLINDLLGLSRIEASAHRSAPFALVDLNHVINEIYEEVILSAEDKGIKVVWDASIKPCVVICDRQSIKQVIMNLVDNAIFYTPEGSVRIKVEAKTKKVLIRVIDTGIGIEKDDFDKIFTKFFRSEGARKVRPDGTGIGMFVAKSMVEQHQGRIWFESQAGKGTTFFVELPIEKPLESQR